MDDTHARAVRAGLKMMEKKLDEVEALMMQGESMITFDYRRDVPEEDRRALLDYVGRTRNRISGLAKEAGLAKDRVSMKGEIRGTLNTLWIILENLTPGRLKGFGEMGEGEAELLLSRIEPMVGDYWAIMKRFE